MNRVEPGTVFTFSGHGISPRTCDSCSAVVVAMTRMVISKAHAKRIEPSTTRCGQNSGSECPAQSARLARLGRAKICSFELGHYSANENSCIVSSQPNHYPHTAQNCRPVLENLTGSSDLSAAGENRSHEECIRGHSLHSQFTGTPAARAPDPHDAVLRLIISHANVQNFSAANFPAQSLQNQP